MVDHILEIPRPVVFGVKYSAVILKKLINEIIPLKTKTI